MLFQALTKEISQKIARSLIRKPRIRPPSLDCGETSGDRQSYGGQAANGHECSVLIRGSSWFTAPLLRYSITPLLDEVPQVIR
jgi:hypothetical protein